MRGMRQWYYATPAGQQAQTDETNLPGLVKSGQITPDTLVWRDGLTQWTPAATALPALFAVSPPVVLPSSSGSTVITPPSSVIAPSAAPARPAPASVAPSVAPAATSVHAAPQASVGGSSPASSQDAVVRRVMAPLYQRKGWLKFMAVVVIVSSIPSAFMLIGIPLVIAGVMLLKAAGRLEQAHVTGDIAAAEETSRNLANYFFIQALVLLISLALAIVASIVMSFVVIGGASLGLMNSQQGSEPLRWEEYDGATLPADTEEVAPETEPADELAPAAPGSR